MHKDLNPWHVSSTQYPDAFLAYYYISPVVVGLLGEGELTFGVLERLVGIKHRADGIQWVFG